jgi:hypothetical protein
MQKFKRGKVYKFRPIFHSGASRKQIKTIRLSFIEPVAARVPMFMFCSVAGQWRETFTTEQIADFEIEEVA